MKKYDFFISYRNNSKGSKKKIVRSIFSRKEMREEIGNIVADGIHNVLKTKMYSHYYNPERFSVEKEYANRLEREVKNCKIFLWVLTGDCLYYRQSKDKIHQDWYFAEILWAAKYDKHILPVLDSSFICLPRKKIASQFRMAFEALVEYFTNFDEQERLFVEADRKKIEEFIQHICDHDTESEEKCRLGSYQKIKIESKKDDKAKNAVSNQSKAKNIDKKQLKKAIKTAVLGKGGVIRTAKNTNGINIWRVKLRIIQVILTLLIVGGIFGGKKAYDWYKYNSTIWDGSTTLKNGWEEVEGNGTKENPYKIKTAKQLAWLSSTSQVDSCEGKYFNLESDIILNEYNMNGIRNNTERAQTINWDKDDDNGKYVIDKDATHYWNPIGSEEYPFQGVFNGNNHVIYGLLLSGGDLNYQGLFGLCGEKSRIKNINVVGASVKPYSTGNYVGAIAGKSDGIIDRCSCYSSMMVGKNYVGGLVGEANIIINSFSNSWIENDSYETNDSDGHFGGVVGECNYIINSATSTVLESEKGYVGGVAGEVKIAAYNCVELACITSSVSLSYALKNDKPISICNVFGNYDSSKDNFTNLFYNLSDQINIQMKRDDYISLSQKHPAFFVGYEEINPNGLATGFVPFNYHDYSNSANLYNQLSKPIDFSSITDELNMGVKDVATKRPDIAKLLNNYGNAGEKLELEYWSESDNNKGAFSNEEYKTPWLKCVDIIRNNWDSSYVKEK